MWGKRNKEQENQDDESRFDMDDGVAFAERPAKSERKGTSSRNGARAFSATVFVVVALVVLAIVRALGALWTVAVVAALVFGVLSILTVRVTLEWERAVVLRLGKLNRVVGPGVYVTIPIIEYPAMRVDQRMKCTFFSGERILTADLVPVDVDAVFYWMVWDAKKACTEVEDYQYAVSRAAQACMRDAIGSMEIEEMATRRPQIDEQIRDQIAAITEQWGVSVSDVKIRNIVVPEELQDALSKAAQAQRERDARMILAEVEKDISSMLVEAAEVYDQNEHALQLRAIHAVSDSVKDNGGLVVVPSALGDSFGKTKDFLKQL